jgi:hypothetical protein
VIQALLLAVSFADDELNPVELGGLERAMAQVKRSLAVRRSSLSRGLVGTGRRGGPPGRRNRPDHRRLGAVGRAATQFVHWKKPE